MSPVTCKEGNEEEKGILGPVLCILSAKFLHKGGCVLVQIPVSFGGYVALRQVQ